MSKLIFKELYLFSSNEKKAKKVVFSPNKTMITSNSVDGTNRGKSIIMKSLYHSMGADCMFEDNWDDANKIYILQFSLDDTDYYIYRRNRLFKLFDKEKNIIFSVTSRHELAQKLSVITGFAVKLPKRVSDDVIAELEITPPVYNYILYFIDQDKQEGSQFASFKSLSEYSNYKENVLYYHFGAFDDEYYKFVQQLERASAEVKRLSKEQEMYRMMLSKIYDNINSVSYSADIEHLREEVNNTKEEYNVISKMLNGLRKKLVICRNEKLDYEHQLQELIQLEKKNNKQLSLLKQHICPFCRTELDDDLDLRIKRYGTADDIVILSSDFQISLQEINHKIEALESEYLYWIDKLEEYKASINLMSSEINDIIRHKGYIEIKDKVLDDIHAIEDLLGSQNEIVKSAKQSIRKYSVAKTKINERYYNLMENDRVLFGLEGINSSSFKNIKCTFSAGGSNNPISTIIWYVNLIHIKNEFNPDAVNFPVVFDSPNNAETDDEKRTQTYEYICRRINNNQLIVSGIGFTEQDNSMLFDKVITLTNEKYELLCESDYNDNVSLLIELTNKQMK